MSLKTAPREPREHARAKRNGEAFSRSNERFERGVGGGECSFDVGKLYRHGTFLLAEVVVRVTPRWAGRSDRNPHGRHRSGAELVAERDRDHACSFGESLDVAGTTFERERLRDGNLLALRKDPHEVVWAFEGTDGIANCRERVTWLALVHSKRTHEGKEGEAHEVLRVHHRPRLCPKNAPREEKYAQGVPEARVVGNDEDRTSSKGRSQMLESSDSHLPEGAANALFCVASEPCTKPRRDARRDHRGASC